MGTDSGLDQFGEQAEVVLREEIILEKFNGEVDAGDVAERIRVVDGVIIQHDIIENGEVVSSTFFDPEGGGDNSTN